MCGTPLPFLGYLEGRRNHTIFEDMLISTTRLKISFISSFVLWAGAINLWYCSLVRILCILYSCLWVVGFFGAFFISGFSLYTPFIVYTEGKPGSLIFCDLYFFLLYFTYKKKDSFNLSRTLFNLHIFLDYL